jgi:7-cyano-7-deazaguanine synthase
MDSVTMLYELLNQGHEVKALGVNYGQRHGIELIHAESICAEVGVEFRIASLVGLRRLLGASSLTSDQPVPHGHYEDASMRATVVPNRNMIMLSIATGWAITLRYDTVAYGAHAGDHAIYPDCRDAFAGAMAHAMELCDYEPITLHRPFIGMTKADIAKRGHDLGVPFGRTWSCYEGEVKHCGKCGTCVERREAFALAGIEDPTDYEL